MDKETILDYVTETPGNTNRNVLRSMLNQFSKSSGGGGVNIVYLYPGFDYDPSSDTTLPALPEGETWVNMEDDGGFPVTNGVSLDGENVATYSDLFSLAQSDAIVVLVDKTTDTIYTKDTLYSTLVEVNLENSKCNVYFYTGGNGDSLNSFGISLTVA